MQCAVRIRPRRPDVKSKWPTSAQGPAPRAPPQVDLGSLLQAIWIIASASGVQRAQHLLCEKVWPDSAVRSASAPSAPRCRPQTVAVRPVLRKAACQALLVTQLACVQPPQVTVSAMAALHGLKTLPAIMIAAPRRQRRMAAVSPALS